MWRNIQISVESACCDTWHRHQAIKMRSPGNCLSAALFSSQVYWSCDFFDKLNDWQLQFRRQYKAHVISSRTVVWVILCPISLKFSCLVKLASASEKSRNHCHRTNIQAKECRCRRLKKDVNVFRKKGHSPTKPRGIFLSSWQNCLTLSLHRHTRIPSSLFNFSNYPSLSILKLLVLQKRPTNEEMTEICGIRPTGNWGRSYRTRHPL